MPETASFQAPRPTGCLPLRARGRDLLARVLQASQTLPPSSPSVSRRLSEWPLKDGKRCGAQQDASSDDDTRIDRAGHIGNRARSHGPDRLADGEDEREQADRFAPQGLWQVLAPETCHGARADEDRQSE